MQDLKYYSSLTYSTLDNSAKSISFDSSILLTSPTGEVVTVATINIINSSSSVTPWVNETVEVFRACPSYGPATHLNDSKTIVVVGRNFLNTTLNYCKWRACLYANSGIHPWRCRNQINQGDVALPEVGSVSGITQITLARYLSPTRVECNVPEFSFVSRASLLGDESSQNFFDITSYNCAMVLPSGQLATNSTPGSIAYIRKCSASSSTCVNKPKSGFEYFTSTRFKCSDDDNSLGVCADKPELGWMFNPCITGEALVEVTNDGNRYSGGDDLAGVSILSTVQEVEPGAIVYNNFKNFTSPPTFAVYTFISNDAYSYNADAEEMFMGSCLNAFYAEEGIREREEGWFFLELHQAAHVLIDLSTIPDSLVYGEHYRVALFMLPSRCTSTLCNSARARLPDEEFVPCKSPSDISNWFDSSAVPKNAVNNITIYALEDIIFKVEVQILYGLFAPYAPFFMNTTSVDIVSPSRALVTEGLKGTQRRHLSQYVSFQERQTLMKYIFVSVVYATDSNTVSSPYNLPPLYSEYRTGRALIGYNVSALSTTPLVLGGSINSNFFSLPADTADQTKELVDAYFETFYGMTYDSGNGFQFKFDSVVLPYLPYFSSCYGYDSYIPIWMAFESPECSLPDDIDPTSARTAYPSLPDQDHIQYVSSWDVGENPIADWCYRSLKCNYEENLANPDPTPRWFELGTSATLFKVLRDPIDYHQYTGRDSAHPSVNDVGGGRSVTDAYAASEDSIINVVVDHSKGDLINGCSTLCYARTYLLEFTYHQMNNHNKRIVKATLTGDKYDFNSADTSYTLNLSLRPLGYIDLLLHFEFDIYLYFTLSCAVGFFAIAICIFTWLCARLTTQLQNPPDIKLLGTLGLIAPPALAGATLAVIPIWILTSFGNLLINGTFFSDPL